MQQPFHTPSHPRAQPDLCVTVSILVTPPARLPLICPDCHLFLKLLPVCVQALLPGHQPMERHYPGHGQSSSSRSLVLTSPFQIPTCPLSGFRDPPSHELLSGLTPPGCLLPFSQERGVLGSRRKEFWGNEREKHQHNHHKTTPEAAVFGTSLSLRNG